MSYPKYTIVVPFEPQKCAPGFPLNIPYFKRVIDSMAPHRLFGTIQKTSIMYSIDDIKDVFSFVRRLRTIVFPLRIHVIDHTHRMNHLQRRYLGEVCISYHK